MLLSTSTATDLSLFSSLTSLALLNKIPTSSIPFLHSDLSNFQSSTTNIIEPIRLPLLLPLLSIGVRVDLGKRGLQVMYHGPTRLQRLVMCVDRERKSLDGASTNASSDNAFLLRAITAETWLELSAKKLSTLNNDGVETLYFTEPHDVHGEGSWVVQTLELVNSGSLPLQFALCVFKYACNL